MVPAGALATTTTATARELISFPLPPKPFVRPVKALQRHHHHRCPGRDHRMEGFRVSVSRSLCTAAVVAINVIAPLSWVIWATEEPNSGSKHSPVHCVFLVVRPLLLLSHMLLLLTSSCWLHWHSAKRRPFFKHYTSNTGHSFLALPGCCQVKVPECALISRNWCHKIWRSTFTADWLLDQSSHSRNIVHGRRSTLGGWHGEQIGDQPGWVVVVGGGIIELIYCRRLTHSLPMTMMMVITRAEIRDEVESFDKDYRIITRN